MQKGSGPVVTLKPDKIGADYKTKDELGYLIALVHSLGKFYVISRSVHSFCAAIEWRSWFIEDLWREYEKQLSWWKRNFSYLEDNLYEIGVEIHETVYPLVRLISSPRVQLWMAREYGAEPVPYWTEFSGLLERTDKYKIPSDKIKKSVTDDLKILAEKLKEFHHQFNKSINDRLQLRSRKVGYNKLLLGMARTIATLLSIVIGLLAVLR